MHHLTITRRFIDPFCWSPPLWILLSFASCLSMPDTFLLVSHPKLRNQQFCQLWDWMKHKSWRLFMKAISTINSNNTKTSSVNLFLLVPAQDLEQVISVDRWQIRYTPEVLHSPWEMVVGRLFSFWELRECMLVNISGIKLTALPAKPPNKADTSMGNHKQIEHPSYWWNSQS